MKHLKILTKFNWWWNVTRVWTISLKFEIYFLEFTWTCFWCYLRQLFVSLAFRKRDENCICDILKIILVQGFRLLKTEIALFPIGFRLKLVLGIKQVESETLSKINTNLPFTVTDCMMFSCLHIVLILINKVTDRLLKSNLDKRRLYITFPWVKIFFRSAS